jgi:hypothetical protein
MPNPTIGERLVALKARSGLSLSAIAKGAGYGGPSSVQVYFSPSYDPPSLSRGLTIRLTKALVGHGNPPITKAELAELYRPLYSMTSHSFSSHSGVEDGIPVYPSIGMIYDLRTVPDFAKGVEPFDIRFGRPAAFRQRPPGVSEGSKVYVTYLPVRSLDPRYRPGEMIIVDQEALPASGESALVFLRESVRRPGTEQHGGECFALEFIERDADGWYFKRLRAEAEFVFPADAVAHVHRIIPYTEALRLTYA